MCGILKGRKYQCLSISKGRKEKTLIQIEYDIKKIVYKIFFSTSHD